MESKLLNCWRCVCTYPFFKCCACAACISGPNSSNSLPHETINTTTTTSAPGGFEMSFLRDDRTRNSVVIEALPQIIPNHLGPFQNHAVESFRYECATINCFSSRHFCGHDVKMNIYLFSNTNTNNMENAILWQDTFILFAEVNCWLIKNCSGTRILWAKDGSVGS